MPAVPVGSTDLGGELREALRSGQLHLVFQPEYDLVDSVVVALEALSRWNHPELGEIHPEEFVSLAEETDLIADLGRWVMDLALAEFASWLAALPGVEIVLRLNASVTQLAQAGYIDEVGDALARHRVAARTVCIEITEATPRPAGDEVDRSIRGLRALGVTVAIDDLASGYSTLGMLRAHPVDVVKIDRTLVAGVDTDPKAAAIIGALVSLAARLRIALVAEGIETAAERDTLVELGCRRGQGFLLSAPLAAEQVPLLLETHARRRPRPRPTR